MLALTVLSPLCRGDPARWSMTQNTDDASLGTDLTEQEATELHAKPGRGARQEPGAGEEIPEGADTLEPDATQERLNDGKDPKNDG